MDMFTPNVVGYNHARYANVISDFGYVDVMQLEHKSDLTEKLIEIVITIAYITVNIKCAREVQN